MARPAVGDSGVSRIDVAKMFVEDFCRQLKKRQSEHVRLLMQDANPALQRSIMNLGQKGNFVAGDALLLLSTSRHHPDTAAGAAGGRLLVGFGGGGSTNESGSPTDQMQNLGGVQHHEHTESFLRELKSLRSAQWDDSAHTPFPEDGGGAVGLNAALSAGLRLLSRYRLQNRQTENFGMGRIPNSALVMPNGMPASAALQPACLVVVTDGACLRQPPKLGGGSLQLQFGAQPLRELYKEPFRWDQRIFCLGVGGREGVTTSQYLHPHLRALCEVTGGSHWMVRGASNLNGLTEALLKRIRPALPRELPLPDPLFQRLQQNQPLPAATVATVPGCSFINGGPVCCFQSLEIEEGSREPLKLRAMLLYCGSSATMQTQSSESDVAIGPPLWCIPESFFPSKKLDTLPARTAQPMLVFSKYPSNLGSKSFEPVQVIKMLHRLDHVLLNNRKILGLQARLLHRDVYICEWLSEEGGKPVKVSVSSRQEYFPVLCREAGRSSLSEDPSQSFLNVGILHVPQNSSTLASQAGPSRLATLTLLPPEPHILLPLLIRAAENEHRTLKKVEASLGRGANPSQLQKHIAAKAAVAVDEQWRSDFRAYLFRLPPYYQFALRRSLRAILPTSAHSNLPPEQSYDSLAQQCFSKVCHQKIRNGEQVAKDTTERLELQEASLKRRGMMPETSHEKAQKLRYGQFDPRSSVDSYLAALRTMPPPWSVTNSAQQQNEDKKSQDGRSETTSLAGETENTSPSALDVLGDLPASCLMAYYESRRRWIFGGPSISTRGLHVDGVSNGGSNSQRCFGSASQTEECLLSIGGVGVSTLNKTSTSKMGDYRERLLFSRSPVVGYGSNDAAGVAATTAVDGSPRWSVDDDAMPMTFFDPKTGEFADSVQARVRSRLMVNFGNPYKEKRADSLVPEKFLAQVPSMQKGGFGSADGSSRTPPGSPPHDSFDSVEEGEAIFVRTSPTRKSPKREEPEDAVPLPPPKKARTESDLIGENAQPKSDGEAKHPPPPKAPQAPPPPPLKPAVSGPKPPPPKKPGQGRKVPPPPRPPPPKPPSKPNPPPPNKATTAQSKPLPPSTTKPGPPQVGSRPPPPPTLQRAKSAPAPAPPKSATQKPKSGPAPAPPQSATQKPKSGPAPPAPLDLQNPNSKPNIDLPAGWMCVWSKSQKRWYFFDRRTNKSVWNWPP